MKTNKKKFQQYLISQIDFEGYEKPKPITNQDKLSWALEVCRFEVGHIEKQKGKQAMIEYWLSGLCSVISLPYTFGDIITTAKNFCEFTEAEEEKLVSNWFHYCAATLARMMKG